MKVNIDRMVLGIVIFLAITLVALEENDRARRERARADAAHAQADEERAKADAERALAAEERAKREALAVVAEELRAKLVEAEVRRLERERDDAIATGNKARAALAQAQIQIARLHKQLTDENVVAEDLRRQRDEAIAAGDRARAESAAQELQESNLRAKAAEARLAGEQAEEKRLREGSKRTVPVPSTRAYMDEHICAPRGLPTGCTTLGKN